MKVVVRYVLWDRGVLSSGTASTSVPSVQCVTGAFDQLILQGIRSGRGACVSGGGCGCIGVPYDEATGCAVPTTRFTHL
jgi:hypothetical protein